MLNPIQLLFYFCLLFSLLGMISSNSWFLVWLSMEINLFSFIPLILYKSNKYSIESVLKYFLIQMVASIFIISSILLGKIVFTEYILLSGVMLKMGVAPLHQWMLKVIEGFSWDLISILLIMQKIGPILLISYLVSMCMFFFILMSSTLGSVGGLYQSSVRKLVVFSSISHMGWILSSIMLKFSLCIMYFFFYSMVFLSALLILYQKSINSLGDILNFNNNMLLMSVCLLSLAGLPPFTGFIPKILVFSELIYLNYYGLIMILLFSVFISLVFYMRLILTSMLTYTSFNSISLNIKNSFLSYFINFSGFLFIPFMI